LGGLSLPGAIQEKQAQDNEKPPNLLSFFAIQEKPAHNDNEVGGSLSFYAIQEK
jgi:hypothetical protein